MSTPLTIGSFERAAQIDLWRQKCREGTMTPEEYKQVIISLRAGRKATSQATSGTKARTKAAKPAARDVEDLFSELDGL